MIYKKTNSKLLLILIILTILGGSILRILYMTADPVQSFYGSLTDPGQYSYAARNMVLFNQKSFAGANFFSLSPFMTYVNYLVYKSFGINFASHRIIPVFFSICTLILFCLIIYKYLGKYVCLFSAIFISINFPILMFSKSANRSFPMFFFFILSLYFFIRGAENKKNIYFVFSAIFFILSYLSKGSILYMISLYVIISTIWLIEKRIGIKNILTFFGSFFALMTLWGLTIYLPDKNFLDAIILQNKMLRAIGSLHNLLHNILNSPFMSEFKSEPVLFFFTLFAVFSYIYYKLKDKINFPHIIEIAFFWLTIGIVSNAMFTQRPMRLYLDLIFPASLLAGWVLKKILKSEIKIKFNFDFILSILMTLSVLILFGFINYIEHLRKTLSEFSIFTIFYLLLLINVVIIFLKKKKKLFKLLFIILIFSFSIYSNLFYFNQWAKNRSYQLKHAAVIFGKVIPPSLVSGTLASLLSTGTLHKTTLISPNFINSEPDFLKQNKIQYLLLTDYLPEIQTYKKMFKREMDNATLLATFKLYDKNIYLYDLKKRFQKNKLEIESFHRNRSTVVYNKKYSQKMGVKFDTQQGSSFELKKNFKVEENGIYEFVVSAKGSFLMDVELNGEEKLLDKKVLIIDNRVFYIKKFSLNLPRSHNLNMVLRISQIERTGYIDFIEYKRLLKIEQSEIKQ